MGRPKFHKLYFPGLISLVFLPALCIGYFLYACFFNRPLGINVIWGNDSMIKSWGKFQKQLFNVNTFRKFNNCLLTGNEIKDKSILTDFERNIKKLGFSGDTINGFSLSFAEHTKYEDVITSIDICAQFENTGISYILYENKILVWKGQPIKSPPIPPRLRSMPL